MKAFQLPAKLSECTSIIESVQWKAKHVIMIANCYEWGNVRASNEMWLVYVDGIMLTGIMVMKQGTGVRAEEYETLITAELDLSVWGLNFLIFH